MEKIKTGWKLPPLILPVALLGANVSGKPNFFTVAWFNMLQADPPLLCASMGMTHYTRKGIDENRTFSINIPSSHMAGIVDYCGLYSGAEVDKSRLFEVFYGGLRTAPMAAECVLNIECRLMDTRAFDESVLIIGEVFEIYCEKRYLTDSKPDCRKMDPLLFFMPEGPYEKTGRAVARAFEIGKDYRK